MDKIGVRKHLKTDSRNSSKSDRLAMPAISRAEPEGTSFHVKAHHPLTRSTSPTGPSTHSTSKNGRLVLPAAEGASFRIRGLDHLK